MSVDLERAKNSLLAHSYTCVLCRGETEFHSVMRGVAPLLGFLDSGNSFGGFSAADKTVGAGAAHLYVLLKVNSVWAKVISESGKQILEQNGISVSYEQLVPYIINRTGDGKCPIEACVHHISDSQQALLKIRSTLQVLQQKKAGM